MQLVISRSFISSLETMHYKQLLSCVSFYNSIELLNFDSFSVISNFMLSFDAMQTTVNISSLMGQK